MSSLYNVNNSISQALLPTRGMAIPGARDRRVHDWAPARGGATGLQQRGAATQLAGSYPAVATSLANTSTGIPGAGIPTSGGQLPAGSVDQTQFQAMLNAASAGVPGASLSAANPLPAAPSTGLLPLAPRTALAAQGLQPASPASFSELSATAAAGAGGGIQNLTSAQFAALTGGNVNLPVGTPSAATGAAGSNLPTAASLSQAGLIRQQAIAAPQKVPPADNLTMSDAAIPPDALAQPAPGQLASGQNQAGQNPSGETGNGQAGNGQTEVASATPDGSTPDTLTMSDAAIPADNPGQTQQASTGNPSDADSTPADSTQVDSTPIGSTDKNGVLVLGQIPDRETRREYAAKGIKWRVTDNPESDKLFFGKDGKLGWDDVLDLINPLQHIPLVNIAYRHFTGDEESGSAELLGAIPFGPLATLGAIADLAIKSTTGKDIGENAIAMITGDHDHSAENLAQAKEAANTTTADASDGDTPAVPATASDSPRLRTYGRV